MTERLWFKIGEAAVRIGATPKEMRYWERIIPELSPRRSKGNLRYYHVDEIPRLKKIQDWLSEGLTVADCRQLLLTGQLARPLLELGLEEPLQPIASASRRNPSPARKQEAQKPQPDLKPVVQALKALVKRLSMPLAEVNPSKPELDR